MDNPTTPGDTVVLPNAHSALINNKLDEFFNSFNRVNSKAIDTSVTDMSRCFRSLYITIEFR